MSFGVAVEGWFIFYEVFSRMAQEGLSAFNKTFFWGVGSFYSLFLLGGVSLHTQPSKCCKKLGRAEFTYHEDKAKAAAGCEVLGFKHLQSRLLVHPILKAQDVNLHSHEPMRQQQ